jgi:hypothetical protein
MIYFVTASKDASVYGSSPTKNTGLDEILTVSKHYNRFQERDNARTFIQFDVNNVPSYVTASNVTLNLTLAQPEELNESYTLYGYPVTESWNMGRGTWPETINTDGINWNNQVGVDFNVEVSQSFSYFGGDVHMDVKSVYDYLHWTVNVYTLNILINHTISDNIFTGY